MVPILQKFNINLLQRSSANKFSANLLEIADQAFILLMLIVEHFGMVLDQDPVADSLRSVPSTLSYDQAEIVVSDQGTVTRKKLHNRNETGAVTEPEQLVRGRTVSCRARSKRFRIGTSGSPGLLVNPVPAGSWKDAGCRTAGKLREPHFSICAEFDPISVQNSTRPLTWNLPGPAKPGGVERHRRDTGSSTRVLHENNRNLVPVSHGNVTRAMQYWLRNRGAM
uniref:(northern house mosquito) hypothetical protein n=1 Tax=Culex pipiens TaxID=7175 RepID=A0A8D7ZVQ6_CULPI